MADPTVETSARRSIDVALTSSPIDPGVFLAAVAGSGDGAVASFVGVVRDNADGKRVLYLEYEAHETMAVRVLEGLSAEAMERFGTGAIAIRHRLGRLDIGEVSVAIAVASPHRDEALDACRWLIDELKTEAPIFKKEHYQDSEAWVG